MQKLKKVILIVGPIVLIIGLYFYMASNRSPVPSTVTLVNVLTGRLENVAQSKLASIPAMDSASGRAVLYPVDTDPAGVKTLGERYRPDLLARLQSKDLKREEIKIDLNTFVISDK